MPIPMAAAPMAAAARTVVTGNTPHWATDGWLLDGWVARQAVDRNAIPQLGDTRFSRVAPRSPDRHSASPAAQLSHRRKTLVKKLNVNADRGIQKDSK